MKKEIHRIWMVKKENGYGLFPDMTFRSLAEAERMAEVLRNCGYYSKVEII